MRHLYWLVLAVALAACATQPIHKPSDDDSNTVNSTTALNPASGTYGSSSYPGQLYGFLTKEDANRASELGTPFQNFVSIVANANSCLGTTGAGLVMTPSSCIAYNAGYRGTETGSITFPNASTCWVAMDENTSGANPGLGNFTRAGSTHYLIDCIDVSAPTMVADSQLLMKVVTSGGAMTAVTDQRTVSAIPTTSSVSGTSPISVTSGVVSLTTVPATLGGTGKVSPTAHDLPITEGASAFNLVALATDTLLLGSTGADPAGVAVPSCGDSSHALAYSTGSHTFSCQALSVGGTGTVNAAPQYDVPYYPTAGTVRTVSGVAIAGLQLDSTSAAPSAYAGVTCTNQFLSALSAAGAGTCTTDTLAGAQHANQGTATTVLHGNAAGNPSFGAVALTTDVSGTLPVANGGTNSTTGATALWTGITATIAFGNTDYISFGEDPGVAVLSAQANAQNVMPYAGTASSLYVAQATAGQAGGVAYAVEKNGTPTTLTCTVNNTGDTTHCNDVTHSFTFAAGDLLDVKVVNSNAASATGVATVAFKING